MRFLLAPCRRRLFNVDGCAGRPHTPERCGPRGIHCSSPACTPARSGTGTAPKASKAPLGWKPPLSPPPAARVGLQRTSINALAGDAPRRPRPTSPASKDASPGPSLRRKPGLGEGDRNPASASDSSLPRDSCGKLDREEVIKLIWNRRKELLGRSPALDKAGLMSELADWIAAHDYQDIVLPKVNARPDNRKARRRLALIERKKRELQDEFCVPEGSTEPHPEVDAGLAAWVEIQDARARRREARKKAREALGVALRLLGREERAASEESSVLGKRLSAAGRSSTRRPK